MPIAALTGYYEHLKASEKLRVPDGYSEVRISYLICLTPEGEIADIISHKRTETNKKGKTREVPTTEVFPERIQTTKVLSNIIEHRAKYIFGLYFDKENKTLKTGGDKDKAKKSFNSFVKINTSFLSGIESPLALAVLRFIGTWNPENERENTRLLCIASELESSYFAFCLNGAPSRLLNNDEAVRRKWESMPRKSNDKNEVIARCAVTGELAPIARIHDNLKGIRGGQSAGVKLVCFKESAYESYGKTQSYNSNLSKAVMKKYTTAFNFLTADKQHNKTIDDMTVLYWATDEAEDEMLFSFNLCTFGMEDTEMKGEELNLELDNILKSAARGALMTLGDKELNPDTLFYTLGVVPNASRLTVRFFTQQRFGSMMKNIALHQHDFAVGHGDKNVYFNQITRELKSPKSTDDKVSPMLITQLIHSAIRGGQYPSELLHKMITRVKTDSDEERKSYIKLNRIRVGCIKACINRKARIYEKKEELIMSLDKTNENPAYLCGRLFAVLERIQLEVSPNLNKTIKDTYFASACATPSVVFPRLMVLSGYHQSKLRIDKKEEYNKLIGEINDKFNSEYPKRNGTEDQGRFIVGYYQQNRALPIKIIREEYKNGSN